jgi:hypothetical protein
MRTMVTTVLDFGARGPWGRHVVISLPLIKHLLDGQKYRLSTETVEPRTVDSVSVPAHESPQAEAAEA